MGIRHGTSAVRSGRDDNQRRSEGAGSRACGPLDRARSALDRHIGPPEGGHHVRSVRTWCPASGVVSGVRGVRLQPDFVRGVRLQPDLALQAKYTGTPSSTMTSPGHVVALWYTKSTIRIVAAPTMYKAGTTG